ncbi:MAG TPA: exodeoxyribonuclease V subunit alpha [Burkholderiaceae bacterium]|jgi:exodeoxyribonuclease V alpha subunit|nr:exodeoxyribonuclease V subunit alpha [Burkholderiaceae bacterium]HRA77390.1 exodeoxyribonuclease V subunit alpha [Burkholderiaceae bacterium]
MTRAVEPPTRVAREFGRTIQAVHARLGGDAEAASTVGRWGTQAWREADAGHVCVDVDDAAARDALAASPLVGPAAEPRPLVLERGALYLYRLWRAESTLAAAVRALDEPSPLAPVDAVARAIAGLFGDVSGGADPGDPQQRAVANALGRRLTVLSGGPGTGKTTTLARLLIAYAGLAPRARIVYAAPTGKAAARLAQSLAAQLPRLDPSGSLRARLPAAGQTVHRLLGARAGASGHSPLDYDLVIVDEASMLDIELAARLCASIGPQSRLVLAGDRDQLASVEAGAVFADLCAAPLDGVVVLERNYRQQDAPDIGALAARIRDASGHGAAASADWPATVARADATPAAIVEEALGAWRDAFDAVAAGAAPARVLAAYDAHRMLAAMRDGPVGVDALNRALAQRVRRLAAEPASTDWYAGRLVMVTKNLSGLGLFNGDVGVCLADPRGGGEGLVVAFGAAGDVRLFPVLQMPACDDAWAMTVHKAQGSEFESVAFVPAPVGHPLNTRELVYTGLTRARSRLSVWGSREAIDEAARRPTQRHGRLADRLAERSAGR